MDITQAIREYVKNELEADTEVGVFHVGEVVPQEVSTQYVWFMRSGDVYDDNELCIPRTVLAVEFDVECCSQDIDESRLLTERTKRAFESYQLHEVDFELAGGLSQTIQAFDVDSHDDTYYPHNLQLDENLHVGTFRVIAYLGETYNPTE